MLSREKHRGNLRERKKETCGLERRGFKNRSAQVKYACDLSGKKSTTPNDLLTCLSKKSSFAILRNTEIHFLQLMPAKY